MDIAHHIGFVHDARTHGQYKIFRGAFATWDNLFAQAAAFATALGEGRVLGISHSANLSDSVVVVWYWDNPAPPTG